ncbi:MFS general substrate transporter [Thozetella sp. PMI_491]|nr:MFS general substrate transporter [Thozetella sp. PMI_491]
MQTATDPLPSLEPEKDQPAFHTDYRFWMVMLTLSFCILLASLEGTVVVTSLPYIVAELNLGSNYIWVTNVFLLTSSAVQPLFGQLCDIFGRKAVLLAVLSFYLLGSGICGGATTEVMLIAGRAIQGIGSGGLNMAGEVIISDMVPLRYRGNYVSILLIVSTVGYSIGPFVGGAIVEHTTWRWIFYLNLPIGGVAMVLTYFFLNLRYDSDGAITAKLRRIDYAGNAILIGASVSVLIALTWAGPVYKWSDARVLAPLLVGLAGFVAFGLYESSGIPERPVIPPRLFPNRTSIIIYANTFLTNMVNFWCFFFFPMYFQAVQLSSPSWSGVQMLPITLIAVPGAAVAALLLARFGKYKLLHVIGLALMTAGVAAISVLQRDSTAAAWVGLQIVPAIGSGALISTLLPAFQASLDEKDQASATATWSFIRTFGMAWGIAVAGTVMNTYTKQYAYMVDNPAVQQLLSNGDAYASATRAFVLMFPEPVQSQIREVFLLALRKVFLISVAFGGTAFVLALLEKDIPLRKILDTKYGLEEKKKRNNSSVEVV